jgi:O-antigen/teichoic acid export membrane protein
MVGSESDASNVMPSRSAHWVVSGVVITVAMTLIFNIAVVHLLTVRQSGEYFIAFSVATVSAILIRFGLDKSVVRFIAESRLGGTRESTRVVVAATLVVMAGICFPVGFIFLSTWPWVAVHVFGSQDLAQLVMPTAVWIVTEAGRLVVSEALRGVLAVRSATILGNAGRATLSLALLLSIAQFGTVSLRSVLIVNAVTNVVVLVLAVGTLLRVTLLTSDAKVNRSAPRDIEQASRLARRLAEACGTLLVGSLPFYVVALMSFMTNGSDVLLAGAVLEKNDVAYYAAASRLAQALSLPMIAVTLWLGPAIPGMIAGQDSHHLEHKIRSASSVAAMPVLLVGVGVAVFNETIVAIVYPDELYPAGPLLAVLAVGTLVTTITGPNGFVLMMAGHTGIVVKVTLGVTLVQVALMCVAAITIGVVGLAIASASGTVMLNLAYSSLVRKRLGIRTECYVNPFRIRAATSNSRSG